MGGGFHVIELVNILWLKDDKCSASLKALLNRI